MTNRAMILIAPPLIALVACGPKANDGGGKDPADLLADACESFCERALSCPPGRYAQEWGFDSQETCTSYCLEFHATPQSAEPPEYCIGVRTELWSCAGKIEDCDTFDAFEDHSFAMSNPIEDPCLDELQTLLHKCN